MNKAVCIALLAVGVVLLVFGFNASESFSSEVSEAVTGTPTDKSMWLIGAGVVAALIGGIGLIRSRA